MAEEHTVECLSRKDALSWEYEYMCDCGVEDRMEITQLKADLEEALGLLEELCVWPIRAEGATDPFNRAEAFLAKHKGGNDVPLDS